MTEALSSHIWLLMTFRHPLTGLPKSPSTWLIIAMISAAVALLRWDSVQSGVLFLVILLIIGAKSPRVASAYALLSIGLDLSSIAVGLIVSGSMVRPFFGLWEFFGQIAIVYRVVKDMP